METYPQPRQADPPLAPPDLSYYHLIHTVTARLPPPVDESPEALVARNDAAIAQIAAMQPVNANEAALAAQCVAARAHADDVLLSVKEYKGDIKVVMRLNAQYVAMLRASLAAHGHLMRAQAVRHKREKHEPSATADAWTRHVATSLMQQALDDGRARAMARAVPPVLDLAAGQAVVAPEPALVAALPAGPAPRRVPDEEAPVSVEAPAGAPGAMAAAAAPAERAAPARTAAPVGARRGARWVEADDPPRDLAEEVEHYATVYPKRAREIRHYGGLPPDCSFGPPDDDLVRALVAGTSPALVALDDVGAGED